MKFKETTLKDAYVVEPKVYNDHRGFFYESFKKDLFDKQGINTDFIQDNHALSVEKGVLRGLHFQKPPYAQAKLIRVIRGSVYDVIVDLRKASKTYGKWEGVVLSADNHLLLYVPRGFAHGYCTLEENTELLYKVDNVYTPDHDAGVIWNDETLNINWPTLNPILSEKDTKLPLLKNYDNPF